MKLRTLIVLLFLPASPLFAATPKQLLASGHADEAIQVLEEQTTRAGADAESFNLLCRSYFMIEEWDRGIAACEQARNFDPQNSIYQLWLARIYGEKADRAGFLSAAGLVKKVRASFERAVELDPRNSEARADLAEFYMEAPSIVGGGKDKARAQADALLPVNPGMAHLVFGRIAEKDKQSSAAEREYRAAIEVTHGAANPWLHMAQFLARANRLDEMEQALRTLEASPVDRQDALMDAAGLLFRFDRDRALTGRLLRRYLQSPVEEGPAFKAHDLLGRLLERQGDRRAAAAEFRAALALSHTYSRAQENLKRVEH
jgi:tetratricopeptide (TPR) repeat protein